MSKWPLICLGLGAGATGLGLAPPIDPFVMWVGGFGIGVGFVMLLVEMITRRKD